MSSKFCSLILASMILLLVAHSLCAQRLVPEVANYEPDIPRSSTLGSGFARDREGRIYINDPGRKSVLSFDGANWSEIPVGGITLMLNNDNEGRVWATTMEEIKVLERDKDDQPSFRTIPMPFGKHRFDVILRRKDGGVALKSEFHRVICKYGETPNVYTAGEGETIKGIGDTTTYIHSKQDGANELVGIDLSGKRTHIVDLKQKEVVVVVELAPERLLVWQPDRLEVFQDGKFTTFSETVSELQEMGRSPFYAEPMLDGIVVGYHGLFLFLNKDGSKRYAIEPQDGLPRASVFRARADDDGNLWFPYNDGIVCIHHSNPIYRWCTEEGSIINSYGVSLHQSLTVLLRPSRVVLVDNESAATKSHWVTLPRPIEVSPKNILVKGLFGTFEPDTDHLNLKPIYSGYQFRAAAQINNQFAFCGDTGPIKLIIDGNPTPSEIYHFEELVTNLRWDGPNRLWAILSHTKLACLSTTDNWASPPQAVFDENRESIQFTFTSGPDQNEVGIRHFAANPQTGEFDRFKIQLRDGQIVRTRFNTDDASLCPVNIQIAGNQVSVCVPNTEPVEVTQTWSLPENVGFARHDKVNNHVIAATRNNVYQCNLDNTSSKKVLPQLLLNQTTSSGENEVGKPPGRQLQFRFGLPVFLGMGPTEYRHRLLGLSDEFSPWSPDSEVTFQSVPPGDYSFEVEAKHAGQTVTAKLDNLNIPFPWYQTTWGWLSSALLACGLVALFIRWRTSHLAYKNRKMEATIKERTSVISQQKSEIEQQAEQLVLQYRTAESDRLKSFDTLVSGIAHDFNNLLTVIAMSNEVVKTSGSTELSPVADNCEKAVQSATELCSELADIVDPTTTEPHHFDLGDLLNGMEPVLASSVPNHVQFEIETNHDDEQSVLAEPSKLKRAILNLVINAGEAAQSRVQVRVYSRQIESAELSNARHVDIQLSPGNYVCLSVLDDGPGIDQNSLGWLFDPFYSTKELGRGLGLSIVVRTLSRQGGILFVDSSNDEQSWTKFEICLPKMSEKLTKDKRPAIDESVSRKLSILIVDDNALVLDSVQKRLELFGLQITPFLSANEALEAVERGLEVDFFLLDISMPEMSGVELAKLFLKKNPSCSIIFFSGFGSEKIPDEMLNLPNVEFLRKPFTHEDFMAKVQLIQRSANASGLEKSTTQLPR